MAALMAARPGTDVETAHDRFVSMMRRPAWMAEAACRGMALEVFFVARGADVRHAKAVCAACAVSGPCRAYAAANAVEGGIWAGVTAAKIHSSGKAAA
jgi:WhiB family redox-sensing transcriptional regulator